MKQTNIEAPQFEYEPESPEGYRAGSFRIGPLLGASTLGASVYEVPPGQSICPYHYEYAEEEWLLVLAGTPSLRHPDGVEPLAPWDIVCFPTGPDGAHKLTNETDHMVRVLMFSDVASTAVSVYPDSDKIGVFTGDRAVNLLVRRSSGVDYYDGEGPGD
jgi:uncharacterized cupin superfamily protein